MVMISAHNRFQMIFIHKKIKRSDSAECRGPLRFSDFSDVCGETKVDRYPSGHPDDHCDGAGLYLETHQRVFKNGEQRICAYQMKALGSLSDTNML